MILIPIAVLVACSQDPADVAHDAIDELRAQRDAAIAELEGTTPPPPIEPPGELLPIWATMRLGADGDDHDLQTELDRLGLGVGHNITAHHFVDQDGDLDFEALSGWLALHVAHDYDGPISLDWEDGRLFDPDGADFADVLAAHITLLEYAQSLRPQARIGYYGVPKREYWAQDDEWRAQTDAIAPLLIECGALFPSAYDLYGDDGLDQNGNPIGPRDAERYAIMATEWLRAAEIAGGIPVYVYDWHRYHNSTDQWGFALRPLGEIHAHIVNLAGVNRNGDRIDGLMLWSAQPYYQRSSFKTKPITGEPSKSGEKWDRIRQRMDDEGQISTSDEWAHASDTWMDWYQVVADAWRGISPPPPIEPPPPPPPPVEPPVVDPPPPPPIDPPPPVDEPGIPPGQHVVIIPAGNPDGIYDDLDTTARIALGNAILAGGSTTIRLSGGLDIQDILPGFTPEHAGMVIDGDGHALTWVGDADPKSTSLFRFFGADDVQIRNLGFHGGLECSFVDFRPGNASDRVSIINCQTTEVSSAVWSQSGAVINDLLISRLEAVQTLRYGLGLWGDVRGLRVQRTALRGHTEALDGHEHTVRMPGVISADFVDSIMTGPVGDKTTLALPSQPDPAGRITFTGCHISGQIVIGGWAHVGADGPIANITFTDCQWDYASGLWPIELYRGATNVLFDGLDVRTPSSDWLAIRQVEETQQNWWNDDPDVANGWLEFPEVGRPRIPAASAIHWRDVRLNGVPVDGDDWRNYVDIQGPEPIGFGPLDITPPPPPPPSGTGQQLTNVTMEPYHGLLGGVYHGQSNSPPPSLRLAAEQASDRIANTFGQRVLLFVGMSNASRIASGPDHDRHNPPLGSFIQVEGLRDNDIVVINGAQPRKAAARWADPTDDCWAEVDQRLAESSVTHSQVRVIVAYHANSDSVQGNDIADRGEYARTNAERLEDRIRTFIDLAQARFPQLEMIILSPREYGGHRDTIPGKFYGEPWSYETAFAIRNIAGVINGDAVVLGPYWWDPSTPREWFEGDGIHQRAPLIEWQATMLDEYLTTVPWAAPWYRGR